MGEIDDGPGHARRAAEEGEDEEPREEEDQDIGGPNPWVREPFRVPIQIRRWHRLHVQIRHFSESTLPLFSQYLLRSFLVSLCLPSNLTKMMKMALVFALVSGFCVCRMPLGLGNEKTRSHHFSVSFPMLF
ncbi:hypothetical protein RHMOL_Rhmol07G0003600 [Rhododendron molle]|uniref:Uncharacterized protein n=1 Tax=Rhododendron molle TaxID=49168 RepID=A0ACC0MWH3_RHOML|nr:hypothetical protein RHMOL_Rhmol07G0003600 [Rhododendron molle]